MGFFDRLTKPRQIVLSESNHAIWPRLIAEQQEFPRHIAKFLKELDHAREDMLRAADTLIDEKHHENIPERAEHIMREHAKVLHAEVARAMSGMSFTTDVLTFGESLEDALSSLEQFRERSIKNISALKEYFSPQLDALSSATQKIEDLLIKTGSHFDERGYDKIMRVNALAAKHQEEREKRDKYERTLNKYLEEKQQVQTRKQKHHERIEQQQELVREKEALEALKKIKSIEQSMHELKRKYERLIFDTKHYLLKNGLTLTSETKNLFDALRKDAQRSLVTNHSQLKEEFIELHDTIVQLDAQDKKDVARRLKEAAQEIAEDAHTVESSEPILHELKKQVMHDIATLNIYEQEQFLLRVEKDIAQIDEKIGVLSETLDDVQDDIYAQELREFAKSFDVVIQKEIMGDD